MNTTKWYDRFLSALIVERRVVDETTNTLANNVADILEAAGMLAMPGVPAGLTGFSVGLALALVWPAWIAVIVALCVGIGFEAFGLIAAHNTVRTYRAYINGQTPHPLQAWYVGITDLAYVGVVGGVIWWADVLPGVVGQVGPIAPLLALMLYISRYLANDLDKQDKDMQTQLDHEREMRMALLGEETKHHIEDERLRLEQQRELDRKRVEIEIQMAYDLAMERERAKHKRAMAKIKQTVQPSNSSKLEIGNGLDEANTTRRNGKARGLDGVLSFLAANPGATLQEIGEAVGKKKSTAGNYVNELVSAGRLHRNGSGWGVTR